MNSESMEHPFVHPGTVNTVACLTREQQPVSYVRIIHRRWLRRHFVGAEIHLNLLSCSGAALHSIFGRNCETWVVVK
jgi:hypothetical protein